MPRYCLRCSIPNYSILFSLHTNYSMVLILKDLKPNEREGKGINTKILLCANSVIMDTIKCIAEA